METTKAFAKAGARVVIAARDLTKANQVALEIRKTTHNEHVEVQQLDLNSIKSINEFVSEYLKKNRPLNILVNNAGIMACPLSHTADGLESQFGVNYFGHFALTLGLMPALKDGFKSIGLMSRVICLSATGHYYSDVDFDDINFKERSYDPWIAYGQSKTACALLALALTKQYASQGVVSNAVNAGYSIMTGLQKYMSEEEKLARGWIDKEGKPNPVFKTVEQGASTTVWAAVATELEGVGGLYLENCSVGHVATLNQIETLPLGFLAYALDESNAEKLWDFSINLLDNSPVFDFD
jgi:NAD(P)-dependent dehydrogenase (short-subunit alcohol dehydrogenase family)